MLVKVIYRDDNTDKAVTGVKKAEDERYLTIEDKFGCTISIAKNRIFLLKVIK